jgi:hypothetical protein
MLEELINTDPPENGDNALKELDCSPKQLPTNEMLPSNAITQLTFFTGVPLFDYLKPNCFLRRQWDSGFIP